MCLKEKMGSSPKIMKSSKEKSKIGYHLAVHTKKISLFKSKSLFFYLMAYFIHFFS